MVWRGRIALPLQLFLQSSGSHTVCDQVRASDRSEPHSRTLTHIDQVVDCIHVSLQ